MNASISTLSRVSFSNLINLQRMVGNMLCDSAFMALILIMAMPSDDSNAHATAISQTQRKVIARSGNFRIGALSDWYILTVAAVIH